MMSGMPERAGFCSVFAVCFLLLLGNAPLKAGNSAPDVLEVRSVCLDHDCIKVEIAASAAQRRLGLMHRNVLPEEHGMLLVFPDSARHSIWMKNMKFPLDLVWIDENYAIVETRLDVQPCKESPCPSYIPASPARYVLEVASGVAEKKGLNPGKVIAIDGTAL